MKTRLIIHGGMHKTGTTAIQNFFQSNLNQMEERGIFFPQFGLRKGDGAGHRHFYIREGMYFRKSSEPLFDQLLRLADEKYHTIVISYEGFLSPENMDEDRLLLLKEHFDVQLICYALEPIKYFDSKYREWVRRHGYHHDPSDFVLSHLNFWNFEKMLSPWLKTLGKDNIKLKKFERNLFEDSSVIKDFLNIAFSDLSLLKELKKLEQPNVKNESWSNQRILNQLILNQMREFDRQLPGSQSSVEVEEGLLLSVDLFKFVKSHTWSARQYLSQHFDLNYKMPTAEESNFCRDFYNPVKRSQILNELQTQSKD